MEETRLVGNPFDSVLTRDVGSTPTSHVFRDFSSRTKDSGSSILSIHRRQASLFDVHKMWHDLKLPETGHGKDGQLESINPMSFSSMLKQVLEIAISKSTLSQHLTV
jgi:hypothetical protein